MKVMLWFLVRLCCVFLLFHAASFGPGSRTIHLTSRTSGPAPGGREVGPVRAGSPSPVGKPPGSGSP
ncbi:hypothetical protein CIPAW_15G146600 [Carya illinoinensis]|uniref:Secreted protein n=1 Tax=Carya illinoinensis TaxID=32201 RepID=A0A8T1NFE0_CARIL|nr:hypothetical protein CIPAW_15G146600 [Carya illinoinensis]